MAYLNSAAIVTAITEQLDGTKTGVRAVTDGVLTSGIYGDLAPEEQARRALVEPRFDVAITSIKRAGPLGTIGSFQLLVCDVDGVAVEILGEALGAVGGPFRNSSSAAPQEQPFVVRGSMDSDYFLELFEVIRRDVEAGTRVIDQRAAKFNNPFNDAERKRAGSGECSA